MVQHCVNAASTDFCSYNSKTQCNAIDVVGSKSSSITNNALDYHIHTLGSMQAGTVDFVSNVLPTEIRLSSSSSISTKQIPSDSISSCKTNTTTSSSSSSGYGSVVSRSSKSRKSLFYRLKRLINFPTTKKSTDYPIPMINNSNEQNNFNSPLLSFRNTITSSKINISNDIRPNSLTRLDIKRKSSRRTLSSTIQHIPFLYGLKNCGNTCYINAIVQCLCHTEQLALYILLKNYEIDMRNIKNVIIDNSNLSQQSIGFKVTKLFVQIFQALWNNSSNTTSKLLYDFKTIISNLNKQYSGNEQNDAQEFLLFLMNTIHDELNLANTQRYRQKPKNSFSSITISSQSSSSIASSELAHRAWLEYIDLNQSIITSTFSAQLHSTLCCNQCKQESKTFEPYLLLSLPIPQKIIKPVFITVVFLNQSPKQLQIGLCLPVTNTVKDVREAIAQQSNLDPNDLVLVEIHQQNGFSQVFHDTESINRLTNDVYAIQFPSTNSENLEHITSSKENSSPSYVNLLVLNRVRYNSGRTERFGAPIVVRVPRQSNYRTLQLSIIKAQRSLIRDEVMEYAQDYVVFQLTLVDQYQSTSFGTLKQEYSIPHDIQWPLYLEKIIEIHHAYDGPGIGPSHIQVYANWHEKFVGEFLSKWPYGDDKPDIHQSVAQARATLHQPSSTLISLADCFSLFTQSESLNYDDAWMCTHCRRKENGTVKHLKIWTTPSVLIIHLKRFCQTKISNSKLTYPVQFPLDNLNIKRFLSTTTTTTTTNDGEDECIIDDEQDESIENQDERQYGLYDLFAVCNHRGSMSNGHYTAYCKNPITNKWFCYDDHLVSELDPSRVCTPDAYILFYKRRDTPPSPTSQSISKSLSSRQEQIDSIVNEFDQHLNLDQTSSIENKKIHYTLQPPLPLPRKLLTPLSLSTSEDECSQVPCPMPRTRISKNEIQTIPQPIPSVRQQQIVNSIPSSEPLNDSNREIISPWSRFNNYRYSNDELESNVVYHTTILR
ncbi:unnamed protein product [Rotaria sordida]|uniref:Ubiquitin carboxyl-terminal hydrolase n=1 Tax=Rotaria sordida TaxID=392033 RepID=A0A819ENW4_9BILA|nr:unnamed protein product [Rotaria sordida]CAF3855160.1 unnamed protein product [Rotaria sordida]CAF3869355.1 unnamed protein product [Rotaria sordida]